ncbi:MAG: hypothetical protein RLZZ283_447 [Candidatus Parcubacteria bacterium]|jgi:hypothetical protein
MRSKDMQYAGRDALVERNVKAWLQAQQSLKRPSKDGAPKTTIADYMAERELKEIQKRRDIF